MIAALPVRKDKFDGNEKYYCNAPYLEWLHKNNIATILISDFHHLDTILALCDILIIPGGYDVDPLFTHLPKDDDYPYYQEIDILDFVLLSTFHYHQKPILGICRGMQIINLYFKGSLFHHIEHHLHTTHPLVFTKNSKLKPYYQKKEKVNSFHHQAIDQLSPLLQIEAISNDGIIEAIAYNDYIIGVQWHPELMDNDPILLYFEALLQDTSQKNKPL